MDWVPALSPVLEKLAAQGILARESPAHLVGEEIWWAGEKVTTLAVRITVADGSGNQTVRQFALEPSDPRVDQGALAAELGVPAAHGPAADLTSARSPSRVPPPSAPAPPSAA